MEIRSLQENLAAEVLGIALWQDVSAAEINRIREAWEQFPVVIIRRQALSEGELTRFSKHFGPLAIVIKTALQHTGPSEISYVTNLKDGNGESLGGLSYGEVAWHTDQAYRLNPATGAVLYAAEVPENAGRTSFNTLYLAWENLPGNLKAAVKGREGVYSYHQRMYVGMKEAFSRDKPFTADLMKQTPDVIHPLTIKNPVTGRTSLYFDVSTLTRIVGLSEEESQELIDAIAPHVTRDAYVYTHNWQPGDVVMWDNGCLLHRRDPFDAKLMRLMKRTTIHLTPERHCVPTGRLA